MVVVIVLATACGLGESGADQRSPPSTKQQPAREHAAEFVESQDAGAWGWGRNSRGSP